MFLVDFRWVIQCQQSSVLTHRCSCFQRKLSGYQTAPWALVRRVTRLSQRVKCYKQHLILKCYSCGFNKYDEYLQYDTSDDLWLLHSLGDVIYGRVMVDPVQNLGDSFICNIEKVFLCTGADGYIPKYNPDNFEYGCLADSPSLLYRFKIIVSVNTV